MSMIDPKSAPGHTEGLSLCQGFNNTIDKGQVDDHISNGLSLALAQIRAGLTPFQAVSAAEIESANRHLAGCDGCEFAVTRWKAEDFVKD